MSIRTLTHVALPAVLSAAVLGLAACGDSDDSDSASSPAKSSGTSTTATRNAEVAAQVPAAIKSKGTLTVAADASYAPHEFIGTDG
jgi:polar amino acid transport system substrate-binding protein